MPHAVSGIIVQCDSKFSYKYIAKIFCDFESPNVKKVDRLRRRITKVDGTVIYFAVGKKAANRAIRQHKDAMFMAENQFIRLYL